MKNTLNLKTDRFRRNGDLLYLFSSYIASDSNFKYNQTYLTDQIDSFFIDYETFAVKKRIFNHIVSYIKKVNKNRYNIEAAFDESFFLENSNKYNSPRIDLLKKKELILKLAVDEINIEYTYLLKEEKWSRLEWESIINKFFSIVDKQKKKP